MYVCAHSQLMRTKASLETLSAQRLELLNQAQNTYGPNMFHLEPRVHARRVCYLLVLVARIRIRHRLVVFTNKAQLPRCKQSNVQDASAVQDHQNVPRQVREAWWVKCRVLNPFTRMRESLCMILPRWFIVPMALVRYDI